MLQKPLTMLRLPFLFFFFLLCFWWNGVFVCGCAWGTSTVHTSPFNGHDYDFVYVVFPWNQAFFSRLFSSQLLNLLVTSIVFLCAYSMFFFPYFKSDQLWVACWCIYWAGIEHFEKFIKGERKRNPKIKEISKLKFTQVKKLQNSCCIALWFYNIKYRVYGFIFKKQNLLKIWCNKNKDKCLLNLIFSTRK